MKGTHPLGEIILVKFPFSSVLGAVSPIPEPIKVKFGREERTYCPLLHAKFDLDQCNVSPLWGEKPKKSIVSTNNTGRAACGRSYR